MKKKWFDQFMSSLNKTGIPDEVKSNDNLTASLFDGDDDFNGLINTVVEAACIWEKSRTTWSIAELLAICESQIESAIGLAMMTRRGYSPATEIFFKFNDQNNPLYEQKTPERLIIYPQRKILKYRVDFQITAFIENYATRELEKRSAIIECDGHDFHEKTKDQAKRDKKRDRQLQSEGHKVFRFTGSEIWTDVFACVEEVFNDLTRHPELAPPKHPGEK